MENKQNASKKAYKRKEEAKLRFLEGTKILRKLRKKLERLEPKEKRIWRDPKSLDVLFRKIAATKAHLGRLKAESEQKAFEESQRGQEKPEETNESLDVDDDETEHDITTAKMRKTIADLTAKLAEKQQQSSLIGKIQLEKFDTAADGKSMSKDEATKKWPRWKKNLDTIRDDNSTPAVKHHHLRNFGGPFVRAVDEMVGYNPADKSGNQFEDLVTKLDNYLRKDASMRVADLTAFSRTVQGTDESVDDYFHRLQVKATACDFGDETTTTAKIREQLVAHGHNRIEILRLAAKNKPLEAMISHLRLQEAGEKEQRAMAQPISKQPITVLAMNDGSPKRRANERGNRDYDARGFRRDDYRRSRDSNGGGRDRSFSQPRTNRKCGGCGDTWHQKREDCPAWNKMCSKCGKRGHFGKICRSGDKDGRRPDKQINSIDDDDWDAFEPKGQKVN